MGQIDTIVDVVVSLQAGSVQQAGFGIPLILGPTGFANSDLIRYYSAPSGMLSDGFTTNSPEYKHALAAMGQSLQPLEFAIGKRGSVVGQVDDVTITSATSGYVYTVSLDQVYSFTAGGSDTLTTIAAALAALINAASATSPASAVATAGVIALSAQVPGVGFTTVVAPLHMTVATVTANAGAGADIAAIQQVSQGDAWYGLALTSKTPADILSAATYIETQKKIFVACSADAAVAQSGSSDIASKLQALSLKRTALLFTANAQNAANGPDAAWLGGQLPQTPGASTWKFKNLALISPDVLTDNQRAILRGNPPAGLFGKSANTYETVAGQSITQEGWTSGGQFLDVTVGIDWFDSQVQTNIFSALVNNPKIPYTDIGATVIEDAITSAIKLGISNGLIDGNSPYSVTIPKVLTETTNNRNLRFLPDAKFSFRLAGAFHFVKINGTVTT